MPDESDRQSVDLYDDLAPIYDDLVRNRDRVHEYGEWLVRTLALLDARRIIDASCGTGAQAVALATAGFIDHLICNDSSAGMLEQCRTNLQRAGVSSAASASTSTSSPRIELLNVDWGDLGRHASGLWDAIVCLGDSFVHETSRARMALALTAWHDLLRPGGHVLVDFGFSKEAQDARAGRLESRRKAAVQEPVGESGTRYLAANAIEVRPDDRAPLGFVIRIEATIASFTGDRPMARAFAYDCALIDLPALHELAAEAGLEEVPLPCGPAPKLHQPLTTVLLRRTGDG